MISLSSIHCDLKNATNFGDAYFISKQYEPETLHYKLNVLLNLTQERADVLNN